MRLLVTGKTGQVATALLERGQASGVSVLAVGRPEFDLCNPGNLAPLFRRFNPDVIVSAAAYTAVDKAESDRENAFAVNCGGAKAVADAAAEIGAPVIHLSTDYVFDGSKAGPWLETDKTAPLGVYGQSKLAGEEAVLASGARALVLRVAWVYAPFGSNFVRTMLRIAETRDNVSVVSDQFGAPTSAIDIAEGVLAIARRLLTEAQNPQLTGIYHMAAGGPIASWADVAEAVFDGLAKRGLQRPDVVRISSSDYPTAAKRPVNSRLDSSKLQRMFGIVLPDWQVSLDIVLNRLLQSRTHGT